MATHLTQHLLLLSTLGAQQSIAESVHLSTDTPADLGALKTSHNCVSSAHSPDIVGHLERLVDVWCHQIEQLLAEGNQMRREADDTGPLAELEYWRQRTAKFSYLVEQIKSQPCRGAIMTLVAAKSKILKVGTVNAYQYFK